MHSFQKYLLLVVFCLSSIISQETLEDPITLHIQNLEARKVEFDMVVDDLIAALEKANTVKKVEILIILEKYEVAACEILPVLPILLQDHSSEVIAILDKIIKNIPYSTYLERILWRDFILSNNRRNKVRSLSLLGRMPLHKGYMHSLLRNLDSPYSNYFIEHSVYLLGNFQNLTEDDVKKIFNALYPLIQKYPRIRSYAIDSLAQMGEKALPLLLPELTKKSPTLEIEILAKIKNIEPKLIQEISKGGNVTTNVIEVFKHMQKAPKEILPYLEKAYPTNSDYYSYSKKHDIIYLIATTRCSEATALLKKFLEQEQSQHLKQHIWKALAQTKSKDARDTLKDLLQNNDFKTKMLAIEMLAKTKEETTYLKSQIFQILNTPNLDLRDSNVLLEVLNDMDAPMSQELLPILKKHIRNKYARSKDIYLSLLLKIDFTEEFTINNFFELVREITLSPIYYHKQMADLDAKVIEKIQLKDFSLLHECLHIPFLRKAAIRKMGIWIEHLKEPEKFYQKIAEKEVFLEGINDFVWEKYESEKIEEVPGFALKWLEKSSERNTLDTVAAAYAVKKERQKAYFFAARALLETPLRVKLILQGKNSEEVEEIIKLAVNAK